MTTQIEREQAQWDAGYAACATRVIEKLHTLTYLVKLKCGNLDPDIWNLIKDSELLCEELLGDTKK